MAESTGALWPRSTAIVVASSLAAQQWELMLAAEPISVGTRAWDTPPLKPYAAWIDELWLEHAGERGPALTPSQSRALWRRVIGESAESKDLVGHDGAAEWAASAWQLLHRWRIDPAAQGAGANDVDYEAFLGWCRRYRAQLDDHGWVDRAELETALQTRVRNVGRVELADLTETYPARTALLARLAANGTVIEKRGILAPIGSRHAVRLADAAEELRVAFTWAQRQLAMRPTTRVALVVPNPGRRRAEIERWAAECLDQSSLCWMDGRTLSTEPTIGAALDALSLAGGQASYATFGRWLRSSFFASSQMEPFARAQLDAQLRSELRSQLSFQAAYRSGVRELLAERAPRSAEALETALAAIGGVRRATPSRWAHLAARFLASIGWQPPGNRAALLGWQTSLDELSRLTAVVGDISLDAALAELSRATERAAPAALPVRGVHVLGGIDDVGPGYDAVWVTGFTDAAWPEGQHGNPLLPLAVQRAHGMPYSSPRDAEERSAQRLAQLLSRSSSVVISWPARVYDYETEPSPAIRDWAQLSPAEIGDLAGERTVHFGSRETVADEAPPLAVTQVAGGTGALGRQARCPLRAFCEDRLGARSLVPLAFGVPARLRGIAVHRAAEALLEDLPTRADLAAKAAAVPGSVERALGRLFGRARSRLAVLYELEAEQLERVLHALLREEQLRAPFRVLALEQHMTARVGPLTFDVRVDRIDELQDGTLAIIDYKTGARATSSGWFGARLRDAQLPLYATQAAEPVSAAAVLKLTPSDARYSGFWPDGAFPARPSRAAQPNPASQLALWRSQLDSLANELAAGDSRIFIDDYEDAKGDYAPLTRVFEQLALARGTVPRW